MRKLCIIQVVLLSSILLISAGSLTAQKITQEREASGFDKVGFSISCDLKIHQGNSEKLIIEGQEKDVENVITEVENGTLKIRSKDKTTGHFEGMTISLTVKDLSSLSMAGSGNVKFVTSFKADDFSLHMAGSGDLKCEDLTADNLDLHMSGSGDVGLGGKLSDQLQITLAGSGDVQAEDLKSRSAKINIAGSGAVTIWATDDLEAHIAGSGDVKYKGSPKVQSKVSGSGSIKSI